MDRIYCKLIVDGVRWETSRRLGESCQLADQHLQQGADMVEIHHVSVEKVMEKRRVK